MAKKRDFAKQKLKVGKLGQKPASATDTSIKAKSLRLRSQGLSSNSGATSAAQISLTKHHAASARRGAVLALTESIAAASHASDTAAIVAAVANLITDSDRTVRHAATQFFKTIPSEIVASNASLIILQVCAAMTHITPAIRADATQLLDAIIASAPETALRVGFARTLRLFFPLLGWSELLQQTESAKERDIKLTNGSERVVSAMSFGANSAKTQVNHLKSLYTLISAGLSDSAGQNDSPWLCRSDTQQFLLPKVPNALAALYRAMSEFPRPEKSIFKERAGRAAKLGQLSQEITENAAARREIVAELRPAIEAGLLSCLRDGGEIGRISSKIAELVGRCH